MTKEKYNFAQLLCLKHEHFIAKVKNPLKTDELTQHPPQLNLLLVATGI